MGLVRALFVGRLIIDRDGVLAAAALLCVAFGPPHASASTDPLGNSSNAAVAEIGAASATELSLGREEFDVCAITLDFDELTGGGIFCDGDIITGQFSGLLFDVLEGDCAICANSLLTPILPASSPPNTAFVQQNTNVCSADAGPAVVTFNPPVMMVGMDFFTSLASDFRIQAFDDAEFLIDGVVTVGTPSTGFGLSGFASVSSGGSDIKTIEISSRSFTLTQPFNFLFDNFIFQEGPCPMECEDPSPRTQGFWRRVCKKNHADQQDRSILTSELCEDLNPDPHRDPCERARSQFAALLLNIDSDRIQGGCIVTETGESVDDLVDTIEALLGEGEGDSDLPTADSCKEASELAASVNEGGVTP